MRKAGQMTIGKTHPCLIVLNIIKAKHLATQEERKIRSLVAVLVDFQLKKMDLKMKQLDELETMLEKERETIENQRRQVRINIISLFTSFIVFPKNW